MVVFKTRRFTRLCVSQAALSLLNEPQALTCVSWSEDFLESLAPGTIARSTPRAQVYVSPLAPVRRINHPVTR